MDPNNFQNFLTSKKFLIIGGILVVILIILISLATVSKKPTTTAINQPTQPAEQVQIPQSGSIPENTNSTESQSPEVQKAIAEQQKVDQEYSDWEQSVKDSYPWRKKMPLTSEKYYVYFDLNSKVFIGRLYLTPEDNDVQIKADILRQLKEDKQIPIENFKFEWQVFAK